jgi:predicted nucleic acid-binding Zn ribbon protein
MALKPAASREVASRLFEPGSKAADALVMAAWTRAVGADLAGRTEVVSLEGGTLRVRVPDARWRNVLHRMRHDILARLRETAGPAAPQRLGFVEGPVAPPRPRAAAPELPSRPAPDSVVAAANSIDDASLRERFLESAGRYLARFASK